MKKVGGMAVLCLALSMVLSTVSYAADVKSTAVIVEDDMLPLENYLDTEQVVTVSEIDQLCDERLDAIVTHNMEKYNEITDTLRSYGVEEISYNDVMCMAGDEGTIDNANGVPLSTETRGGITFETFDTNYNSTKKAVEGFISGKRYQSSVTRVIFKGIEDQIIEQRNLKNPTASTDVGY